MTQEECLSKIADLERQIEILKKKKDPEYEKVLTLLCQQITVLFHNEYFPDDNNKSDDERNYHNISNRTNNFLIMNDYEPIFYKIGDQVLNDSEVFVSDLIETNNKELDRKVYRTNVFGLKKNGKIIKPAQVTKYEYKECAERKFRKFSFKTIEPIIFILSLLLTIFSLTQGLYVSKLFCSITFVALFSKLFVGKAKEQILNLSKIEKINYIIVLLLMSGIIIYSSVNFNLAGIIEASLILLLSTFCLTNLKLKIINENVVRCIVKNKVSISSFVLVIFSVLFLVNEIFAQHFSGFNIAVYTVLLTLLLVTTLAIFIKTSSNSVIDKILKTIYIIIVYAIFVLSFGFNIPVLVASLILLICCSGYLYISIVRREK